MSKVFKCLISLGLGGLCLYLASTMNKDQQAVIYFLYLVAFVNFYIGIRDVMSIYKEKK
jgi:hypothetical protein